MYFISMHFIEPSELLARYKIRWNIEIFHRTAKQSLWLKDCQMKSIEKQLLHASYVMLSYAQAEIIRIEHDLPNIENALRLLRNAKPVPPKSTKQRPRENFGYDA